MDLVVAGTKNAIAMVEAGASEVSEEIIIQAVKKAQETNEEIIQLQEEIIKVAAKKKMDLPVESPMDPQLIAKLTDLVGDNLKKTIFTSAEKGEKDSAIGDLNSQVTASLSEEYSEQEVAEAFESLMTNEVRSGIVYEGRRPDGRNPTQIRPIECETSLLPRTHGSGLFTRGQTQVLSIATLGSMAEVQKLDTISPDHSKRYLHHYNFPPYSVGEVRRMGGPGRREIGHGALAERALLPVIPNESDFPYTIRVVSESVSSNGSTSMGSVCGSTLALMDAGVPLKAPIAGIAMGLVMTEDEKYVILTDIQGVEDHLGDMDFKVAGSKDGITALQMDIKVKGITYEIMEQALSQAKEARLFILEQITNTLSEPRAELSPFAPRMHRIRIPIEKIGALIGPGGKTIRSIIEESGATINVDDDGTVTIGSSSQDSAQVAINKIEMLTKEAEVGAIYTGKVARLMSFGAFVEILPGKDGLVHISELSNERVASVEDVVNVGDEITVLVTEIDSQGRINLSRRALLGSSENDSTGEQNENSSGGSNEGGRDKRRDNRPNRSNR